MKIRGKQLLMNPLRIDVNVLRPPWCCLSSLHLPPLLFLIPAYALAKASLNPREWKIIAKSLNALEASLQGGVTCSPSKWLGMSKELLTEEHLCQRTFRAENQPNPTFKGSNHRLVDDDDHKAPIMCEPPPPFCRQSSSKRAEDQEGRPTSTVLSVWTLTG